MDKENGVYIVFTISKNYFSAKLNKEVQVYFTRRFFQPYNEPQSILADGWEIESICAFESDIQAYEYEEKKEKEFEAKGVYFYGHKPKRDKDFDLFKPHYKKQF